ncbi:SPFH domain-containing protein [Candidatus Thiothrix sp. Deng01]|uniref:SPFH domain-containing protein n=1 Tax=Candidatus Thiothrix phosphatis TaxID=3112415 RepID=A0ABU6CSP6_9GAMM|nr:SPFH domain-containing protein [Candidatus Thiothrix sp. Deng01]MEB4589845.1 SPFH domain-containing protein [Candidatus Thiothrix sp. Deng01]
MFGIKFYKADSSTYVIKTVNGTVRRQGKGLSFFYNAVSTSIAAVPINVQEAPFIFNLQTADFQSITVQGQLSYQIADPVKTAEMLNFTLKPNNSGWLSEDPLKLADRVIRSVGAVIQNRVENTSLRDALRLSQELADNLRARFRTDAAFAAIGIALLDITISAIKPTPETARALEAEAREAILQEADDATYARRKSAVEQERMIREAELQTELSMQQKEQEIAESRLSNERTLLRASAETERERLQASIEAETQRQSLVALETDNSRQQSEAEGFAIAARMNAFKQLPVEHFKAMAMAKMQPEQLMAMAFESLAQNAGKIGELNITPDLFGQALQKAVRP